VLPLRLAATPALSHERFAIESVKELEQPITLTETKIPLGELVQKVAADTGAPLSAAPEVADEPVAVPIYGKAESLNLAAAAAVCLYASARAQRVHAVTGQDGM